MAGNVFISLSKIFDPVPVPAVFIFGILFEVLAQTAVKTTRQDENGSKSLERFPSGQQRSVLRQTWGSLIFLLLLLSLAWVLACAVLFTGLRKARTDLVSPQLNFWNFN